MPLWRKLHWNHVWVFKIGEILRTLKIKTLFLLVTQLLKGFLIIWVLEGLKDMLLTYQWNLWNFNWKSLGFWTDTWKDKKKKNLTNMWDFFMQKYWFCIFVFVFQELMMLKWKKNAKNKNISFKLLIFFHFY